MSPSLSFFQLRIFYESMKKKNFQTFVTKATRTGFGNAGSSISVVQGRISLCLTCIETFVIEL